MDDVLVHRKDARRFDAISRIGIVGSRPPGQLRLWNIEGLRVTTSMMSGAGKTKAPAWAFQVVLDGSDGLD